MEKKTQKIGGSEVGDDGLWVERESRRKLVLAPRSLSQGGGGRERLQKGCFSRGGGPVFEGHRTISEIQLQRM